MIEARRWLTDILKMTLKAGHYNSSIIFMQFKQIRYFK